MAVGATGKSSGSSSNSKSSSSGNSAHYTKIASGGSGGKISDNGKSGAKTQSAVFHTNGGSSFSSV